MYDMKKCTVFNRGCTGFEYGAGKPKAQLSLAG